jgi:sulfane dehydrogenase subunit SoxC
MEMPQDSAMKTKAGRRRFLAVSAGAAVLTACDKKPVVAEHPTAGAAIDMRPYGERSLFEKPVRAIRNLSASSGTGSSRTPLQDLYPGMITPSSLHFERHHAGVPTIDPAAHKLLLHGLVEKPLTFTMDDIRRFPAVSRICFLECGGNNIGDQRGESTPNAQQSHGLVSGAEWTGVPLAVVLREAGLKPAAKWVIAEGADNCRLARSIPLEKALQDTLLLYGQNGEALRPEQGYPLRLILPGFEGNMNVKWLRRLNVLDQPAMSSKETAYYTELRKDGKAEMFSFVMEARSVITRPSGGQKLQPGAFQEICGLAWSGRGRITGVEVSVNGGRTWEAATLQTPVLSQALTAFRLPWKWNGEEAVIQSRCTDETGYLQPSREELVAVRGLFSGYHYNAIKPWKVMSNGEVVHVPISA